MRTSWRTKHRDRTPKVCGSVCKTSFFPLCFQVKYMWSTSIPVGTTGGSFPGTQTPATTSPVSPGVNSTEEDNTVSSGGTTEVTTIGWKEFEPSVSASLAALNLAVFVWNYWLYPRKQKESMFPIQTTTQRTQLITLRLQMNLKLQKLSPHQNWSHNPQATLPQQKTSLTSQWMSQRGPWPRQMWATRQPRKMPPWKPRCLQTSVRPQRISQRKHCGPQRKSPSLRQTSR